MSLADLQAQLNELQVFIQQTAQLIVKLSKTQSSDEVTGESTSELAADIRDNLQNGEEQLELLKEDVDETLGSGSQGARKPSSQRDIEREREHATLKASCARLTEDLKTQRVRYRRAHLQAKKNEEKAVQLEQEVYLADLRAAADAWNTTTENEPPDKYMTQGEMRTSLFANRRAGQRTNPNQTKDDLLLTASSDLTTSLRRTHEMLTSELSRSRFAQETLESSNAALQELNQRYTGLDELLAKSRGLLRTLMSSQKSDTWFLQTAMWMLMITIGWLIFRRLLYGPLWWFAYLPLKFAYNTVALIVGSSKRKAIAPSVVPSFQTPELPRILQANTTGSTRSPHHSQHVASSAAGVLPMSEMVGRIVDAAETIMGATEAASALSQATEGASTDDTRHDDAELQPRSNEQEGQQRPQAGLEAHAQQEVRRADGTVLRERDPAQEPLNPKKRMWEEPPPQQQQQRRDEL